MRELIECLMDLFRGNSKAHGEYIITSSKGVKTGGKAMTVQSPPTVELWERHLSGSRGLGIIPITEDSTCWFAAIDIDCYENFDPAAIAARVEDERLPLVVCRSKSGGAHCYLFLEEPAPAVEVRAKLRQIAISLGYPKAEIFPKQDLLRANDIGNWINMPYYHASRTTRYAFAGDRVLTLEEFVEYARSKRLSAASLRDLTIASNEFSDAPPCLETLCQTGFPPGTLNNALFDMGVYARMKYPSDWQRWVFEFNERFMGPGTPDEVQQIIRSLDKKRYTYRCQEPPICGVCNKLVCASRPYGIASEHSPYKSKGVNPKEIRPCILDEVERPVTCYSPPDGTADEPYWTFTIHGQTMDVTVDMVASQVKFCRAYLIKFKKVLLPIDDARWARAMNELLATAEEIEMAPDAGPEGQLLIHLENFCTGKVQAKTQDEILLGKPYIDGDRVFFRSQDLMKYLDLQRFKVFNERELFAILKRNGAKHHKLKLKGRCVACWSMQVFEEQTEGFDVPSVVEGRF